jgi:DNA mismatch repair protein MutS
MSSETSTVSGRQPGEKNSPLIQQYLDIKSRHPDSLLFFRVGDFYEMFFEDAEEGSGLLGITLTSRNNGGTRHVPLAGVPVKAANEYVSRLLKAGRRVAICSQAEGLVRREVVEVITPGTVLEDTLLSANRNNFVVAVAGHAGTDSAESGYGVAVVDLSTGEFETWKCGPEALWDELGRLEPAEILIPDGQPLERSGAWTTTRREPWRFDPDVGSERLRERFAVRGLEGFGFRATGDEAVLSAAGALVQYLEELRPAGVSHLRPPRVLRRGRFMHLDEMTRRNLEIVEPLRSDQSVTLLSFLDLTRTPMGGRLLRRRLLRPLVGRAEIEERLDAVAELVERDGERRVLRDSLRHVRDLERLAARVAAARATPRELLALGISLSVVPELAGALPGPQSSLLAVLLEGLDPLADVRERIELAIDPDAPAMLREGGVIRAGYSPELDQLRGVRDDAVDWIAGMQVRERDRSGIDSLKVGYNKVFGYYLEVTRANLDRVPEDYVRKQTLTNAERYLTPELKEWEAKVIGADEKIAALEERLFQELREAIAEHVGRIQDTAGRVAALDVHAALAEVAVRNDYVRPRMTDDAGLDIRSGRHPVVERVIPREDFIPNDTVLNDDLRIIILTGPNMAGKSTVLRQVGLIVLMAQAGSFVPAAHARIGLCDRIFTRVGASDNLAAGMSTFLVEMTETATILNSATGRSLVLLDEIGRGTSTYDGVSIAWAVTEHLHEIGARTVFATHYHELVELAELLEGAGPFNVTVREVGDEIVFLHRVEPGGSDRSYGVYVGRLAGLPPPVVARAAQILKQLENGPYGVGSRATRVREEAVDQLSLFAGPPSSPALDRLDELEVERMTPLEALNALAELKRLTDATDDPSSGGSSDA